jgi:hypothetical protein
MIFTDDGPVSSSNFLQLPIFLLDLLYYDPLDFVRRYVHYGCHLWGIKLNLDVFRLYVRCKLGLELKLAAN